MPDFIYALCDPRNGEIRYIGKTNDPKGRLRSHINQAKMGRYRHHTANWLRSLIAIGLKPDLIVIYEVAPPQTWQDAERSAISAALKRGCRLTNYTSGGDGCEGAPPEVQAAKARAMRKHWARSEYREAILAHRNSPEFHAEQGDRLRKRWRDPVKREKMNDARWTPEARSAQAKRIAKINKRPLDQEMVKRRNAAIKASWDRRRGIA